MKVDGRLRRRQWWLAAPCCCLLLGHCIFRILGTSFIHVFLVHVVDATEDETGRKITDDIDITQEYNFSLQCLDPSVIASRNNAAAAAVGVKIPSTTKKLQCIYHDDHNITENVHLVVPPHFVKLSRGRVFAEINYHLSHPRHWWSPRVVLEMFYYSAAQVNGTHTTLATTTPTMASTTTDHDHQYHHNPGRLELSHGWLRDDVDICDWEGVTCGETKSGPGRWVNFDGSIGMKSTDRYVTDDSNGNGEDDDAISVPNSAVTKIDLSEYDLVGMLPEDLYMLTHLRRLDVSSNQLHGTLPPSLAHLTYLEYLDVGNNKFHGTFPLSFSLRPINLRVLRLESNQLSGSVPPRAFAGWSHHLQVLELGNNRFRGTLGADLFPYFWSELKYLSLSDNSFSGSIPTQLSHLSKVQALYLANNQFTGTIPSEIIDLYSSLQELSLQGNRLSGSFPTQIMNLIKLKSLRLGRNQLNGTIPSADDRLKGGRRRRSTNLPTGKLWSHFHDLGVIDLGRNRLSGTLPPELPYGLRSVLTSLDLSGNQLTGTIPPEIGNVVTLRFLDASSNKLVGSLPGDMMKMSPDLELNLTDNLLTGTVPSILCKSVKSAKSSSGDLGCSTVLCPAGTYHPEGAASMYSACRPCPPSKRNPSVNALIGRTSCDTDTGTFLHGDVNGDGVLSQREVLFLFFVNTVGPNWGIQFQSWGDMDVHECILAGVTCAAGGQVVKLDLSDAFLCVESTASSSGSLRARPCLGLPSELSLLPGLEVLQLQGQGLLAGTIPAAFGRLKKLRVLDISHCTSITGTIPNHIGRLTNLRQLLMQASGLRGTLPTEIFRLTSLEKLFLSMTSLTGTLPTHIGRLENIKDFSLSRTHINGTIPTELGNLLKLENLEMYGNYLVGRIPTELGGCKNLKRIDIFNNGLTGSLPPELANARALQIIHLKLNSLTGSVSSKFGEMPSLTWFDVSNNELHGTIPVSFASSPFIKDLRFGGNMIYDPIPQSLCSNTRINSGATRKHGCDGVICPRGTYADLGHATLDEPCRPCPEGKTSMYLGSLTCRSFSTRDLLTMFFDVMGGENWPPPMKRGWKDVNTHECSWAGVVCDGNRELISLGFPISNVN